MSTAPLRLFVTGTDTNVGKTQVACALASLMADAGLSPVGIKPYESGMTSLDAPADAIALRAASRCEEPLDAVCVHRFALPLAPAMAAPREGREAPFEAVDRAFRRLDGRSIVVEGAGGLRVPLDATRDVIDLIAHWQLPVVLAARAGLGTLNHVALSLEALAARRIETRAVVLSQVTPDDDPSVAENAAWIARRHALPVIGPVPYEVDPARRQAAFRDALRPWLMRLLAHDPIGADAASAAGEQR